MKMAQVRENRKDNKGFSLVELIIVIAIMVALVAMLAPQFVKYVAKSRNAVVTSAAEDVLATAKSEFALIHLTFSSNATSGTIKIGRGSGTGAQPLAVTLTGLDFNEGDDGNLSGQDGFAKQCGIDSTKKTASDYEYTITVTKQSGGSPTFEMRLTRS
ncbi:MAG: type II secretion system protein [Clostridia bacterium]|nr:type II secretion system protein [Clostridia bacterium]